MIIIKSADAASPADLDRLAETVGHFVDNHYGAQVTWLQSSAGGPPYGSHNHRLTAIVSIYTPKPGSGS